MRWLALFSGPVHNGFFARKSDALMSKLKKKTYGRIAMLVCVCLFLLSCDENLFIIDGTFLTI